MAITKTFTYPTEIGLVGSCGLGANASKWPMGLLYYYYVEQISENGLANKSLDISGIPKGAVIESAHISWNFSASYGAVYNSYQRITNNSAALTDENILAWLRTQTEFDTIGLTFGFNIRMGAEYASTDSTLDRIHPQAYYRDVSLQVVYTPPNEATVSYGVNNAWQKCNVFYGTGGAWQKCKAHFGVDGAWKETK